MQARLYKACEGLLRDDKMVVPPAWVQARYDHLYSTLVSDSTPFPCHFGVHGIRNAEFRYTFVEDREILQPLALVETLGVFLREYKMYGGLPVLIAWIGESATELLSFSESEALFWATIQFLHDNDPCDWPSDLPTDPIDPHWEFCFAGKRVFVNAHAPCYRVRKTRRSWGSMMLVLQATEQLDAITGATAEAEAIRRNIRAKVEVYDGVPASPELGTFGVGGSREWKMFWLPDDNLSRSTECPLRIKRKKRDGRGA
jgi:uncharacterized protein